MKNTHKKIEQLANVQVLRVAVLLIALAALTTVAVVAFSYNEFVWQHEYTDTGEIYKNMNDEAHVLQTGTAGEGGAPWRMYPDGTIIVDSGYINWPYRITGGPWDENGIRIIFTGSIIAGPYLRYLFMGMSELIYIEGLHYFDTSNVVDMRNMFSSAFSLTSLDLSSWDTSNVTNMRGMFARAVGLTSLDISSWDTSKVTDMSNMFFGTDNLVYLDISNWDTGSVTNMSYMFSGTPSLINFDISNWDTSNVTNMRGMFERSNIMSLDASSWDTSSVTNMRGMFAHLYGSVSDLSGWNTANVTDMSYMFANAGITELNIAGWDISNVTNMKDMFSSASRLTSLDLSSWDTGNVTDMSGTFSSLYNLSELNITNWDTSNVTDMSGMFVHSGIKSLDLSSWDTGNVIYMRNMFHYMLMLTCLDISGWNTSNVTDMSWMFFFAYNLSNLNVSGWDTSNVTNMYLTFANTNVTRLDLSSWDTRNVLFMCGMFYVSHFLQPGMREIILGEYFVFVLSDDELSFDTFHLGGLPDCQYNWAYYVCIDLPQVPTNEYYTGYWQNVGPGTTYNPQGTHMLTSDQLVATFNGATMADTWVWQPRRIGEGEESTSRITGNFTIPNPTRPVTIELVNNAAIGRSTSTAVISPPSSANTDIHFYFENLPPGTYSLVFSKPGHTSFTINNIVVTATEDINLTTDPRFPGQLPLLPGNLTGDGQINITDLNILIQNWMGTCEDANLTGSGQVNIADLNLLLRNWMAESVVVD